ncbi:MAG: glycosyltransferase family 9 protein [Pseudomonadota bacterium]
MSAWDTAEKVLCVRLDALGDVLMCTPAMRAIKQSRPGRHVTLLSSGSGALAAPYIPELDAVLTYPAPWVKHSAPHDSAAGAALLAQLAAQRFDAAVIFTSYSQSALPAALMCLQAGIPLRLAHCRENPYQMLTDWVPDPEPGQQVRHEVQRQLDLVASVGWRASSARLSFAVPDADLAHVRACLAQQGIAPDQPFILLHPGASAASRRYPAALWADVVQDLSRRFAWPLVVTGTSHESALADAIVAASGVALLSLAGQLSLGQLGAAIRLAGVVVANNTGPAHMAAALGTPLVNLYALTNPQHTPWQVDSRLLFHDVPCRFCYKSSCPQGHHDCLAKVAPQQVVEAVRSLMWHARARYFDGGAAKPRV